MMTCARYMMTAFIMVLISTTSMAAISEKKAENLLDIAGLNQQFSDIASLIQVSFQSALVDAEAQEPDMSEAELQIMNESVESAFTSEVMLGDLKTFLATSLSDDEYSHLIKWYQSDLGKAITEAENSASTVDAYLEMHSLGDTLLEEKPRIEFANRLDNLVGGTEMLLKLQSSLAETIHAALVKINDGEELLELSTLQEDLQWVTPQMEKEILKAYVYTYRQFDLKTLAQYEAFVALPKSQRFHQLVSDGLFVGLNKAFENWVSDFYTRLELASKDAS